MQKSKNKWGYLHTGSRENIWQSWLRFSFWYPSLFRVSSCDFSLIMSNIYLTSMYLLWNESRTNQFQPLCGLYEGDPLSPYLFNLCMERLGHLITRAINEGNWHPFQLTRYRPNIYYYCFDDVFLVAKANPSHARFFSNLLNIFFFLFWSQS